MINVREMWMCSNDMLQSTASPLSTQIVTKSDRVHIRNECESHTTKILINEWPQYFQPRREICFRDTTNQLCVVGERQRARCRREPRLRDARALLSTSDTFQLARYKYSTTGLPVPASRSHLMLYPLKHGLHYYTYLNTVWAQFWRPTLTLVQKYRRLDGPRVHSRLCLLIHHCTSARFGKTHDFTVTARGGTTGPPESRHAPPQHGSAVSRLSSMCLTRSSISRLEVKPLRTETAVRGAGATSTLESVRAEAWTVAGVRREV